MKVSNFLAQVDVNDYQPMPGEISGIGSSGYYDTSDEALDGLAMYGDDEVLYGVAGLGAMAVTPAAPRKAAAANKKKGVGGEIIRVRKMLRGMSDDKVRALAKTMLAKGTLSNEYKDAGGPIYDEVMRRGGLKFSSSAIKLMRKWAGDWNAMVASLQASSVRTAPAKKVSAPALLKSIIKTAQDMNKGVQASNKAKIAAAKANPLLASKLAQTAKAKAIPGTNVQQGIIQAFNDAAKLAKDALAYRNRATNSLKRNDKAAAAASTVKYMELLKKSGDMAVRAEKTRLATGATQMAKTLDAQANALTTAISKMVTAKGPTASTMKMQAKAGQLASEASRLKRVAAVVADQPNAVPGLPTQKRIAELANKYNIRTAAKTQQEMSRALISVLGDVTANPLALAQDYEGAISYYNADAGGQLMADIEFSNYASFLQGLDGLGQAPEQKKKEEGGLDAIMGFFKSAGDAINGAVKVAGDAWNNVVKPAAKAVGIPLDQKAQPPKVLPKTAAQVAQQASRTPPAAMQAQRAAATTAMATRSGASTQVFTPPVDMGPDMMTYVKYGGIALGLGIVGFIAYKQFAK